MPKPTVCSILFLVNGTKKQHKHADNPNQQAFWDYYDCEVCVLLADEKLGDFIPVFMDNGIRTNVQAHALTQTSLEAMGITNLLHIKRILRVFRERVYVETGRDNGWYH